jgi:hypothetical protein
MMRNFCSRTFLRGGKISNFCVLVNIKFVIENATISNKDEIRAQKFLFDEVILQMMNY